MPNAPRPENPGRQVRVEDDLWEAAKARAEELETTISASIRSFLLDYVGWKEDDL